MASDAFEYSIHLMRPENVQSLLRELSHERYFDTDELDLEVLDRLYDYDTDGTYLFKYLDRHYKDKNEMLRDLVNQYGCDERTLKIMIKFENEINADTSMMEFIALHDLDSIAWYLYSTGKLNNYTMHDFELLLAPWNITAPCIYDKLHTVLPLGDVSDEWMRRCITK